MKISVFTVFLIVCFIGCNTDNKDDTEDKDSKPESEMVFDKDKWRIKDGGDYTYRDKMLNDIVYNDTIRSLNKEEILTLFGEPSYYRNNENYFYYTITKKRLGSWTLRTKTMVIKFSGDNTIEWIKIHN